MPEFQIDVIINPAGAARGGGKVRKELGRVEKAANRVGRSLRNAFAFLSVAAGLTSSINLLRNFSQEMSTVRAVTGATQEQFEALNETAQTLGRNTRFTATQAAEGMTFLARAGFDTNEVLQTIEGTLTLAQAGALGLGRAADIASNVLKGFNLEADETGRVVDVLALAANSSNTNVEQLGSAMSFVAPVAAGLGVSIENTAAAIGELSNAGVQGTRAGTALRTIFLQLISPTTAAEEVLDKFNLTAADVNVQSRGLGPVLDTLAKSGVGIADAGELVGTRFAAALNVLIKGRGEVNKLTGEFELAEGSAAEFARVMDDNLNGAFLRTISAIQGFVIRLGENGATGALRSFFESVAVGVNFLTDNIREVGNAIQALSIVIGVQLAQVAIPKAIAGIKALTVAIAANPIGFLVTSLTVAVATVIGFADQINILGDGVLTLSDFFTAAGTVIGGVLERMAEFFGPLLTVVTNFLNTTAFEFEFTFRGVVETVAKAIDFVAGALTGLVRSIPLVFKGLPKAIGDIFIKALNGAVKLVENFINFITDGINVAARFAGLEEIGTVSLGRLSNPLSGAASQLGSDIGNAFSTSIEETTFLADDVAKVFDELEKISVEKTASINKSLDKLLDNNALFGFTEQISVGDAPLDDVVPAGAGAGSGDGGTTFQDLLNNLAQERELLQLSNREREIRASLFDAENQLERELLPVEAERLENELRSLQALRDQADILDSIRGPQENNLAQQAALSQVFADGAITLREYTDAMRELQIAALDADTTIQGGLTRGLLVIQEEFANTTDLATDLVVNGFRGAEDAIVDFVNTGKLEFSSLVDSIAADITRLAIRESITGPLSELFAVGGGSSGGSTGGSGGIGSLIGSFLGGFNNGADFTMGGRGGVDNNLVSMRLSRGERVQVTPSGQQPRSSSVVNNFNIATPDPASFKRSQGQILARTNRAANTASSRNN